MACSFPSLIYAKGILGENGTWSFGVFWGEFCTSWGGVEGAAGLALLVPELLERIGRPPTLAPDILVLGRRQVAVP